jgi:hypothetical protein
VIPHTVTPQISASARAVGEVRPRSVGQLGPSSSAKEALRYLIIALIAAMSIGGKDVPLGSAVCIRRDDGTDRTLLRARPTNSRSDDAFVAPKVAITSDDRLQLLQRTAAEGCAFSLVRTSSGVEGYVQSKYIALAPAPAAVGFDASSILASGGHTQFNSCSPFFALAASADVRIANVGALGFLDSWRSNNNVWLWGDGVDIGQHPDNITWSVVAVLECPGSVQIKHLPTGRLLYDSPDGWVRAAGEAHEPRRSHWILKNRLEGHVPLSPGVFYVINSGSGKFLDGARFLISRGFGL